MVTSGLLGNEAGNVLVLRTEAEAWDFLENLQKDDYKLPEDVAFGDWCTLKVYLKGDKWNSSLTPSIFPVFQEYQKLVYRTYAEAKYKSKNKKLTKQERDDLEIIIAVSKGSSDTNTKVDFTKIAQACISKMSGKEILIGVTILALAWGSTTVIHDYLQTQRDIQIAHITSDEKKALLQSYQFMSAEETKRMEIFAKAMSENELAQGALDDSSHLHKEMLKSATKAQNSEINGVKLDQAIASELVKAPQESPQPQQINGTFEVLNLSWEKPNTITLRKIDDGRIVKARFDLPLLSQESKDVIKNTEWKENGKRHLEAKINARVVKGRVVTADLVSAEIKK